MPTYIVLGHFTDQGIRAVRDSLKREDAFRKQCEKVGAQVKDIYRTMGRYDLGGRASPAQAASMKMCIRKRGASSCSSIGRSLRRTPGGGTFPRKRAQPDNGMLKRCAPRKGSAIAFSARRSAIASSRTTARSAAIWSTCSIAAHTPTCRSPISWRSSRASIRDWSSAARASRRRGSGRKRAKHHPAARA